MAWVELIVSRGVGDAAKRMFHTEHIVDVVSYTANVNTNISLVNGETVRIQKPYEEVRLAILTAEDELLMRSSLSLAVAYASELQKLPQ